MNTRLLTISILTMVILHSACSLGEESAVRAVVQQFFERAQKGEIESALELVVPEHPTARLLLSLKREDPSRDKEVLAELAGDMSKSLNGAELLIRSVELTGDRASVKLVILRRSVEEESSIVAVKRSGKWLLESIPSISESDL